MEKNKIHSGSISGFIRTLKTDKITGGTIIRYEHESGFSLQFLPKPGFSKKFAGILVPFGSVHTSIQTQDATYEFPAGTAHYMEHCVFSKDDEGGLMSKMSALGASANAYTSNTHTMYYFTCVENLFRILRLYMNSIVNPYIESDRVESERDIIIQELEMYEDDPDSNSYRDLLHSLYVSHPVREDIGGTVESVKQINSGHLKTIKENFYAFPSVSLTLSGDIDEEEIIKFLKELDIPEGKKPAKPNIIFPLEPFKISANEFKRKMDVDVESFIIGVKNPFINSRDRIHPKERIRFQKGGQIYLETLLGSSSDIYEEMFSEGLINDSFGFHLVCENTYSYLVAGGESRYPEKAADKLYRLLNERLGYKIDSEEFEIQKRVAQGNFLRSLESVEHCGMSAAIAGMYGTEIFEYPQIYSSIDMDQTKKFLEFIGDSNYFSRAFVLREDIVK